MNENQAAMVFQTNSLTRLALAANSYAVDLPNAGSTLLIGGTQVVATRGAAVADATDAGTAITQLNAWLARARAHGLIAT